MLQFMMELLEASLLKNQIEVIAIDADDTLWQNEIYFQEAEHKFIKLMDGFQTAESISEILFQNEMENLEKYGYGIKGFVLSMLETYTQVSTRTVKSEHIQKIIQIGHELMDKPIILLDGVMETLEALHPEYHLILATKGDLIDQERKLKKSGIEHFFDRVEIMSDKKEGNYHKIIRHLNLDPHQLFMVGNSLKSDILPVLKIGGYAGYIPHEQTWNHEIIQEEIKHPHLFQFNNIQETIHLLL